MKKFQIKRLKINLKGLLVTMLALNLIFGFTGMLSSSVAAISVTKSFVPYDHPAALTSGSPADSSMISEAFVDCNNIEIIITAPSSGPFCLNRWQYNGSPARYSSYGVYELDNPCSLTPVDLKVNFSGQALFNPAGPTGGYGPFYQGLTIGIGDYSQLQAYPGYNLSYLSAGFGWRYDYNYFGVTPQYYYSSVDPGPKSKELTATSLTMPNIGIMYFENNEGSTSGPHGPYRVDGLTYTLTYPDNMSDCTYPAASTPIATDPDISTTPSSTPVTINILGNDTGTGLSVSKIDNQTITSGDTITLTNGSGTVKLNTDGTITFTPNSTFSGESIFSYSITDGASTVDTGVVRITVAAATTTTTTTTTPSTPTASSASTNSTKVLAKTGEDVRLLAGGGMLVLVAAIYIANLRFKLGKY